MSVYDNVLKERRQTEAVVGRRETRYISMSKPGSLILRPP